MATFGTGLLRDYDTAKWIEDHDWQRDLPLTEGQRVRATCDLLVADFAINPMGGVVVVKDVVGVNSLGCIAYHMGGDKHLVVFDNSEVAVCKYNPRAVIYDDGWGFDTEITLADEPDTDNDPRQYMKPLF